GDGRATCSARREPRSSSRWSPTPGSSTSRTPGTWSPATATTSSTTPSSASSTAWPTGRADTRSGGEDARSGREDQLAHHPGGGLRGLGEPREVGQPRRHGVDLVLGGL